LLTSAETFCGRNVDTTASNDDHCICSHVIHQEVQKTGELSTRLVNI